jgi:hypothetical protein
MSWWTSANARDVDLKDASALVTAVADLLVQAEWNRFIQLPDPMRREIVDTMFRVHKAGHFPYSLRAIRIMGMVDSSETVTKLREIAMSSHGESARLAVGSLAESCDPAAATVLAELQPRIERNPELKTWLDQGHRMRKESRRCP